MPRKMKESGVEWLGQIPEGWDVLPLKGVCTCNDEVLPEDTPKNYRFDYVDIGAVKYGQGIVSKESLTFEEAPSRARRKVFTGDVIVSTVRTYLKSVALISAKEQSVVVSTGFAVLRPSIINSQFLFYLANSQYFSDMVESWSTGISYPSINAEDLLRIKLPFPSLPEQQRIAAFLDERCAKIDGMISEAKTSIEDYRKWKQSLIENVTLKGVGSAPLAAVSSDWVEQVPAHWRFMQIRYLLELRDERNEKPLSEVNLISLYTDKGVVQHCDLEKTTGNKAATADGYKLVYEDDIVVNIILCWMGAIGRSAYAGVTSPAYDVYRAKRKGEVLPRYYHYLFRTTAFSGACYRRGRGIMMMRWRTYSDEFRSIKVPVPSYAEQEQIANYLDEKCAAIDKLVGEKEALIADLEAYKKSLIFETVTGKREVA